MCFLGIPRRFRPSIDISVLRDASQSRLGPVQVDDAAAELDARHVQRSWALIFLPLALNLWHICHILIYVAIFCLDSGAFAWMVLWLAVGDGVIHAVSARVWIACARANPPFRCDAWLIKVSFLGHSNQRMLSNQSGKGPLQGDLHLFES